MIGRKFIAWSLAAGAACVAAYPILAEQRPASGPIARYDMRAGTVSGMGAMGRGGMGMGMIFGGGGGGGGGVQHELYLRLGSSRAPANGSPKADHFMPPDALLGRSVPLVTPRVEREPTDQIPGEREGRRPQGRMLIFWGCGEHAPKGQPVVIDFSKIAPGHVPPGLWTSTILRDWGPTLENSRTFGRWPAEDGKFVKPDSSLLGEHRVSGNYSPDMTFTLTKDFMQALHTRDMNLPSGAVMVRWNGVPGATGYLMTLFGGKQGPGGRMGDMVMWSSSENRQFGGGLDDWLSPGQVARLVRDHTVLAPATTSCTIPAEVKEAAPDFRMNRLTAFGPEEDFSYPPRPASSHTPWHLEWTARARFRSTTSWMVTQGMTMGRGDEEDSQPQNRQDCKPRHHGLGGMLGGVLGGRGC